LDALVAPARVLPGQPQDQRNQLVIERRTTASTIGLGPFARDQPPVPSQDRVRRQQEDRPASARKRAAQHREQRSIGRMELGPLNLAAQHSKLVAEHGDLDVFGVLAAKASEQHADKPACHEVEEGQGHRPIVPDPTSHCSEHPTEVSEPHGAMWSQFRDGCGQTRVSGDRSPSGPMASSTRLSVIDGAGRCGSLPQAGAPLRLRLAGRSRPRRR
jgi:hypothetical protein